MESDPRDFCNCSGAAVCRLVRPHMIDTCECITAALAGDDHCRGCPILSSVVIMACGGLSLHWSAHRPLGPNGVDS
jgi:hypothetical protein